MAKKEGFYKIQSVEFEVSPVMVYEKLEDKVGVCVCEERVMSVALTGLTRSASCSIRPGKSPL